MVKHTYSFFLQYGSDSLIDGQRRQVNQHGYCLQVYLGSMSIKTDRMIERVVSSHHEHPAHNGSTYI